MYTIPVEGLNVVPVGSYQDIKLRMNEGDRQRTIASTKMNETSRYDNVIDKMTINQLWRTKYDNYDSLSYSFISDYFLLTRHSSNTL